MDPITLALGLATAVPKIVDWLTGNSNATATATKIVGIAQTVAGVVDPSEAVAVIKADPTLAAQMQTEIDNAKSDLAKIASSDTQALNADIMKNESDVNATMQSEVKSEHWLSWCWRPICGITWCVLTVLVYVVLPLTKTPVPAIPESVWLGYTAILGVASFFRGKAQADPSVDTGDGNKSQQG